jgi:hypothetical protein
MKGMDKEDTPWEPRRRTVVAHANFIMMMISDSDLRYVGQVLLCRCEGQFDVNKPR